jgi:hypothetical protein
MADETADCNRHEHLIMCLRFSDNQLDYHEVLTGFHELEHQDAATSFSVTSEFLIRFDKDMKYCMLQNMYRRRSKRCKL